MTRKSLSNLYSEHQGKISDKWSSYLPQYDRIFAEYRDMPLSMLEIGIQNGGSLDIWSEYFPVAEKIVGCDINTRCSLLEYQDSRVHVVVGDANQTTVYNQIVDCSSAFDIVIDDGSHRSSDIITSFFKYFPLINEGGVFVAEDLHCSYWQDYEGGLYDPFSSINFFKLLADIINREHWGLEKGVGDVLSVLAKKYAIEFEPATLESVNSIEFINSMCVVRKGASEQSKLGERIITGTTALAESLSAITEKTIAVPSQLGNFWSARELSPAEELPDMLRELRSAVARGDRQEHQIDSLNLQNEELKKHIHGLDGAIDQIHSSLSWRLTSPLRAIGGLFSAGQDQYGMPAKPSKITSLGGFLLRDLPVAIRRTGSFSGFLAALKRSGAAGISRIKYGGGSRDYERWVRLYDCLSENERSRMQREVEAMENEPLISVVMPTYNPMLTWLEEAIRSVQDQIYQNWELCIADDASTDPSVRPLLEEFARNDPRIKVIFRKSNGHISAASNSGLEATQGSWVALLDHDDLLSETALYWIADSIKKYPDASMIYSDEDKIDESGNRSEPYFKCDWNPDLFYSQNMFSHLGVYKKSLLSEVSGFAVGMEGSQDYDLALRCIERIKPDQIVHIPRVLYHWRVHAESTAQSADAKPYAMLAGERALNEHFKRLDIDATASLLGFGYRVRYGLPSELPLVSIIIPTRNSGDLVRTCIESIAAKTTYANYEIVLVDNGSDDAASLAYFEELASTSRALVIRDDRPFNFSQLNNSAVENAKGDLLAFINNDIEVISSNWLTEMVSHAMRPEVGAVGARLWYPNNTLQHGGIILGIGGGVANHSHRHSPRENHGYFGRMSLISSFSAVTAACLVIRKSTFHEVGGFNEQDLRVAYNDVDFCLRIRESGYRNVFTPYADLYHYESAQRGDEDSPEKQSRLAKETQYMKDKWGHILQQDPAYSPNLTLDYEDFSYAFPPRLVYRPARFTVAAD